MIRLGESGKAFRYATAFDMSSYTNLTLKFTAPDGTVLTKNYPAVYLAGAITDPYLGALSANEYMEYLITATDFTQAGTWSVCGTYTNSGSSQIFEGLPGTFTVLAGC